MQHDEVRRAKSERGKPGRAVAARSKQSQIEPPQANQPRTDSTEPEQPQTSAAPTEDTRAGQPAEVAIPALAAAHANELYQLALRLCGNAADAEDLVQEVFLRAWRGWPRFEGRSSPRTWLYTIAGRTCQRMRRRRSGAPAQIGSLDASLPFDEPRIAVIAAEQPTALQQQIAQEAQEQVERAIAALPDDFRLALVLKDMLGFSTAEVAQILGLELGTVKSRVHRARLRLRQEVDRVLPRQPQPVGPPAYSIQHCLDLLDAKQAALDRGEPFSGEIICERCRSVFGALDLAQETCRALRAGEMPTGARQRLLAALKAARG